MSTQKFSGARNSHSLVSDVLPISNFMTTHVATTEVLITNPDPSIYNRLVLDVETLTATNGFRIRYGDYRELGAFDATTDVDDVADLIDITGIGASYPAPAAVSFSADVQKAVEGPFQLSVASGVIVVGLVMDTNYWIVVNPDNTDVDEVAFYATLADALAWQDAAIAADARLSLTDAAGTVNFAGMANNGLNASGAQTDGYASKLVIGDNGPIVLAAPDKLTIIGFGTPAMQVWWTP